MLRYRGCCLFMVDCLLVAAFWSFRFLGCCVLLAVHFHGIFQTRF